MIRQVALIIGVILGASSLWAAEPAKPMPKSTVPPATPAVYQPKIRPDGRRIVLWTTAPTERPTHALPIVMGAGFARRMHHFAPIAMYAAANVPATLAHVPTEMLRLRIIPEPTARF